MVINNQVHIIGGGLAGSEAAWQIASCGIPVTIHEMRPIKTTPAHQTDKLAELVCSNSFRSDNSENSAIGLLHHEMRNLNSLILYCADKNRLPAGGALAVDREKFSFEIQKILFGHPLIKIQRQEVCDLIRYDREHIIIASGPLTSSRLADQIYKLTGEESLAFFDAIAPIVHRETINFEKAWFQSRYDKGSGSDYINCPLNKKDYDTFIKALGEGDTSEFKQWEIQTPYFEGCLPIEEMASRGHKTLAFGPMKPVGLKDPRDNTRPYAVVQLRQDNSLATLFNMVGFQTKLKHYEQKRIFRMIPGLEGAEFARLGGMHRNTFINAPKLLDDELCLRTNKKVRFAGQITGCEGYVESAAVGLMAGLFQAAEILKTKISPPPVTCSIGALLAHLTSNANPDTYQPMNINFGLFPALEKKVKRAERKEAYTNRGKLTFVKWKKTFPQITLLQSKPASETHS